MGTIQVQTITGGQEWIRIYFDACSAINVQYKNVLNDIFRWKTDCRFCFDFLGDFILSKRVGQLSWTTAQAFLNLILLTNF